MPTEYSIAELGGTLNVTRSGYPAWAGREPGARARANAQLLPLITQAHRESRQTYGRPRILHWLHQRGQKCGRPRIARLMRVAGWSSRPRRRCRPVSLTDSQHDLPVAPNRLRDLAIPQQRDAIWVADITYVETAEGWLSVAGVWDRGTRRCVGWAMGDTLATTLPLAALEMALKQRRPTAGLVHHADRGVQYASAAYRQRLAQAGVIPSMSRPGNCYDNAAGKASGAAATANGCSAASSPPEPPPELPSLNGSKSFTTASGATAPSAIIPLWTLKPTSTKYPQASCIHYLSTQSRQGQWQTYPLGKR